MSTDPIPQIGGTPRTDQVIRELHLQIEAATCDPRATVDLEEIHTALLMLARIVKGEIEWREAHNVTA